ncbi:MAG: glycosyltransferase family 2 protein [Alphaproteobacteria bacterium]|nr:glycosyltransferase family 2 protein [Alphaproteobacteria bacterium]
MHPEVSILTRTRARVTLLKRAGQSILAQTAPNIEWVVVNDGGDPNEVEAMVESVRNGAVEISVVHHDTSVGRTAAANAAIEASSAPLLLFLDDDDTLDPGCAAALKKALDAHASCVGAVGASTQICEKMDGGIYKETERRSLFEPSLPLTIVDVAYRNSTPNNTLMFRRAAANEINGFNETLDLLEDWDFLLRLLLIGDVCAAPNARSFYHVRPEVKGEAANTQASDLKEADVYLRNAYLREDIARGRFGLGVLTNVRDPLTSDRLVRFLEMASTLNAPLRFLRRSFRPGKVDER